ncbi:hypothetical protein [Paenibacillus timonensis]|uniref:hypothetical protein n=1 Tax=Paenibacillus timonensis TaxID=225915 RepID=UPI0022E5AA4A|nr:hypothetical protein [Paenibacillus timonensis]
MNSSIVSYPNRGPYGSSKYRGNCSGHLIADLLDYYQPKRFVEVFAGGGTGADVAKSKGIRSIHLDLNPQFGGWNALTDDIPTGADLIFSHPPYHSMVVYSGNMWGKPHPDDLSRCKSYEEFIQKLNIVNSKIFNSLLNGGRHALLIGDMRKNGKYYSIIKDMNWYGDLEAHVIKEQHQVTSGRKSYAGSQFIPILHEHLLIFRKSEIWAIPITLTKRVTKNLLNSKMATWRDLVQAALESLGGKAMLSEIYEKLEASDRSKQNPHWKEKIRQVLQMYDSFASTKRGEWSLI